MNAYEPEGRWSFKGHRGKKWEEGWFQGSRVPGSGSNGSKVTNLPKPTRFLHGSKVDRVILELGTKFQASYPPLSIWILLHMHCHGGPRLICVNAFCGTDLRAFYVKFCSPPTTFWVHWVTIKFLQWLKMDWVRTCVRVDGNNVLTHF